jgi:predicted Zn-dependent peptidase
VGSLAADGITAGERDLAYGYLEGSLELSQEDSGSRMARIGRNESAGREILDIDEHLRRLRAVTVEDVHRALRRVFEGRRSLVAVGPFDSL